MKTTAPEKFRVRPGIGVLAPGENVAINLVALRGSNVTKDKFLVLSTIVEQDMSPEALQKVWRVIFAFILYKNGA